MKEAIASFDRPGTRLQMTVPARPKAPKLTADDLRELGIAALGHRRLLLEAIAVCLAESGASALYEKLNRDLAAGYHGCPLTLR